MAQTQGFIDIDALKAQVDADLAARILQEAEEAKHIQRRSFWVSGLPLLVALDISSEVVEMPKICRLPGAPHGVRGLVNRHGRVIPVLDLARLFNLPDGQSTGKWLLVCGRGEVAVGLMIDGLPERKVFDYSDAINLADITSPIKPYAQAAYRQGNQVWMDLDTDAFFEAVFAIETA
ncbi:MAG: chemotaxis protein CheW [Gallionella sp.]